MLCLARPAYACPANVADCPQETLHQIGAEGSLEYNPQDQPMVAYRPVSPPAQHPKLVVIFHGHTGPLTTAFAKFQTVAAGLGMYSIALDADFNGVNAQPDYCAANLGANSPCDNAPKAICGCYTNCYEELHGLVTFGPGASHPGLPDPVAGVLTQGGWVNLRYLPVELRLSTYLHWLAQQPGGAGWAGFLNADNSVKYDDIILVGLSRGAALAGYIAKNRVADRLLMFSGPSDILQNDGGFGDTSPTTYRYGVSHGGACTQVVASPHWIHDNDFYGNTGTHWKTQNIFTLIDSRTSGYASDGGAHVNWLTLHMEKAHAFAHIDTFFNVQTYDHPNYGYTSGHYRALVSDKICETAPDGDDGHVETLSSGGCSNNPGSTADPYRATLWTYMLTD